jgi:protoheme IX farnesyltransferase
MMRHGAQAGAAVHAERSRVADLVEMTKPRIAAMAALTTAGGYYLGNIGSTDWVRLLNTVVATFVLSGGAAVMNEYIERDRDALMDRTRNRPLPAGRIEPWCAFYQGIAMGALGLMWLALAVNPVAAAVGALAFSSYVLVYTPLKRVTSLCTIVGAVPGALPPVIGWAAARGEVNFGAMVLFSIMFLWQLPHSLAIGWMYREDYARGGFKMAPVVDDDGHVVTRQAVVYLVALLFASFLPFWIRLEGRVYLVGAFLLGTVFLATGVAWLLKPDRPRARRVFFTSLFYLLALFALVMANKLGA